MHSKNSWYQNRSKNQKMDQIIELRSPDNSVAFFQDLKRKSEEHWMEAELNEYIYGLQTQRHTKWKKGLTEEEIDDFESQLGMTFPAGLRNFYRVMNGVDLPAIDIHGSSGEEPTYSNSFYSYPRHVEAIKQRIRWIYDANQVDADQLSQRRISRIFPVYGHRIVLIDDEDEIVLSMFGKDIIYWADNISKMLAGQIFGMDRLSAEFHSNKENAGKVKFWLDWLDNQ